MGVGSGDSGDVRSVVSVWCMVVPLFSHLALASVKCSRRILCFSSLGSWEPVLLDSEVRRNDGSGRTRSAPYLYWLSDFSCCRLLVCRVFPFVALSTGLIS